MTGCIHAIVAARLGRGQESLNDFRDSYQPFMRGPWDAFSEKRTTNNVYFLTGMAGSLQSVLYGFAGLQVCTAAEKSKGMKLAGDNIAVLYADPHLPPGWGRLTLYGIKFRGRTLNLTIDPGNKITVSPQL
jgi:trehalose/maltose hydrolase-like predicted phosphorylase